MLLSLAGRICKLGSSQFATTFLSVNVDIRSFHQREKSCMMKLNGINKNMKTGELNSHQWQSFQLGWIVRKVSYEIILRMEDSGQLPGDSLDYEMLPKKTVNTTLVYFMQNMNYPHHLSSSITLKNNVMTQRTQFLLYHHRSHEPRSTVTRDGYQSHSQY